MLKRLAILLFSILFINCEPYCIEGENNCIKCHPVTKLCYKCSRDIYTPDENGGCKNAKNCIFGNNYCLECDDNTHLCNDCEKGYFPDENGGCSNTPNCQISYKGECLECIEDFILIGKNIKICKSLNSEDLKNCKTINTIRGECEQCEENYFLNKGDKKCIKTENCYQSAFGVCSECNENYYLNKKESICKNQEDNIRLSHCKISLDEENCEVCEENFFLDTNGLCVNTNNCKKGNEFFKCEQCKNGYYLTQVNNTCTSEKKCYEGIDDLNLCTYCLNDYYIDTDTFKCKSNLDDNDFKYCRKVENGECVECKYDYYLSGDKKCSKSRHCLKSRLGKCSLCEDNYFLGKDNICTNIDKCIASDIYNDECDECQEGYYYSKNDKICKIAEGIFENCKNGYDNNYCLNCKDNYYLEKKEYLCLNNNIEGQFYKCVESSFYGDLCIKCAQGYYLGLDYKCSNIAGCVNSEDGNKCYECNRYYCLDAPNKNCIDNTKMVDELNKFYYKCNKTNEEGDKCEICINGYSLNKNGICVHDKGCKEKDEDDKCISCNEGFCLNQDFECVETKTKNCSECNDNFNFNRCSKCESGYILDADKECFESD